MRAHITLLIGLFVGGLLPSTSAEARRVALVIGNGAYRHADGLLNPINDATAISQALERLKFDRVTLLANLDVAAMRKALLAFEAEANDAAIALVYFAGHGIEVDGQNYLIPTDARLRSSAAVEIEAVSLTTVTTVLAGVRGLRLIILDACRNNPFRPVILADASKKKRSIGRGLKAVEPADNELIAFAAAAGTEAADGDSRHSPFTTALLNNIERPGLEIGQLFRVVRDEVMKATAREQTPHVYGSLGSEQIFLNPSSPAALSSGPETSAERHAASKDDSLRTARQKAEHALMLADAARRTADLRQHIPAQTVPPQQQLPEIRRAEIDRKSQPATAPYPALFQATDEKQIAANQCGNLQGAWTWYGRYLAMDVNFKPDGSSITNSGVVGKWTCSNGRYRVAWINGLTDTLALSPDGRRLSGTSWFGNPISANRK